MSFFRSGRPGQFLRLLPDHHRVDLDGGGWVVYRTLLGTVSNLIVQDHGISRHRKFAQGETLACGTMLPTGAFAIVVANNDSGLEVVAISQRCQFSFECGRIRVVGSPTELTVQTGNHRVAFAFSESPHGELSLSENMESIFASSSLHALAVDSES